MTDTVSKETRTRVMRAVKSENTKPEIIVRKGLWKRGFRYRLNSKRLPGHPDLVLRKYRTCIFVNGCFWHGHKGCNLFRIPKTNVDFWEKKIQRNQQRDVEEQRLLAEMGWHCIVVWECELKKEKRELTLDSIALTLNKIYLQDRTIYEYPIHEETIERAAEDIEI